MTAAHDDLPIPADLALDEPPITDTDLDTYLDVVDEGDDPDLFAAAVDDSGRPRGPKFVHQWRIEDDSAAEWAMRRVAAFDAEVSSMAERADEWATRIRAWFENGTRPLARRRAFFVAHLERYATVRREQTGKATLNLPSGKVSTRSAGAAVVVADEAAVIAWAKANLDDVTRETVIKVAESILVSGLREVVSIAGETVVVDGGEIVPGVAVRPAGVSATVTPC